MQDILSKEEVFVLLQEWMEKLASVSGYATIIINSFVNYVDFENVIIEMLEERWMGTAVSLDTIV